MEFDTSAGQLVVVFDAVGVVMIDLVFVDVVVVVVICVIVFVADVILGLDVVVVGPRNLTL